MSGQGVSDVEETNRPWLYLLPRRLHVQGCIVNKRQSG
jgi:hypothetical protein